MRSRCRGACAPWYDDASLRFGVWKQGQGARIKSWRRCGGVLHLPPITTPIYTTMSTTVKSSNVGGEYQPLPMAPMDVKEAPKPRGEKQKRSRQLRDGGPNCYCHCEYNVRESGNQQQEHGDEHGHSEHGGCHRKRLRRAAHFSFASVVMLTLVLFMAFKCRLDLALFGSPEGVHISGRGLEKRQSTGSTGSSSNGSTQGSFVKNKREYCTFFACEDTRI